jgi:hypothetical protein
MRWIVAVLSLTVLGAIFGSAAALVLGLPSLPQALSKRQVVSISAEGGAPVPAAMQPKSLKQQSVADGRR